MTPEQLAEIEARAAVATPGPWEWEPTRRGVEWEDESGLPFYPQGAILGETLIQLGDTYEGYRQDCAFITHARQDIPALCAEVRRLQAIEAEYNSLREQLTNSVQKTNARNQFLFGDL